MTSRTTFERNEAGYMRPAGQPPQRGGAGYMRPDAKPRHDREAGWMDPERMSASLVRLGLVPSRTTVVETEKAALGEAA